MGPFWSRNTMGFAVLHGNNKLQTAVVLSLRHLLRLQLRSSFIACFDPLLGTLQDWGNRGSTVVINKYSSTVGSSYCCASSTRLSKMIHPLLDSVSSLSFFWVSPSLPVQKTVATLNLQEISGIRYPLGSSIFSNIFRGHIVFSLRCCLIFPHKPYLYALVFVSVCILPLSFRSTTSTNYRRTWLCLQVIFPAQGQWRMLWGHDVEYLCFHTGRNLCIWHILSV